MNNKQSVRQNNKTWFDWLVGIMTILSCGFTVYGVWRSVEYVKEIKVGVQQQVHMINEMKNEIRNEVENAINNSIENTIRNVVKNDNRFTLLFPQNPESQSFHMDSDKKENSSDGEKESIKSRHPYVFCQ